MSTEVPSSLGNMVDFHEVFDSIKLMYGEELSELENPPPAKLFFYNRDKHVLTISFPEDANIADPMEVLLIQSLLMVGNLNAYYTLFLSFGIDDFIDSELDVYPALNITAFNIGGYFSTVYPYIIGEDLKVGFLDDLEKDDNYLPIPNFIEEALYWSTTVKGLLGVEVTLSFLEKAGCKIDFVGDESVNTLTNPYNMGMVGDKLVADEVDRS